MDFGSVFLWLREGESGLICLFEDRTDLLMDVLLLDRSGRRCHHLLAAFRCESLWELKRLEAINFGNKKAQVLNAWAFLNLALPPGLEPGTCGLTVRRSTD